MKSIKLIYLSLIVALVGAICISCSSSFNVSTKLSGSIEDNGEVDKDEGFEFKVGYKFGIGDSENFDEIKDKLLGAMQASDVAHYGCEDAENFVLFTIWQDGNTDLFVSANNGDEEAIKMWNENRKVYDNANSQLYKIAKNAGLKKSFRMCILNDENLDNALIIYQDGACIYDPINDIDETISDDNE